MINYIKKRILIKLLGKVSYARKLGVKIGENCRIYISYWGTEPELISVGNNVTITSDVTLLTHDGSTCLIKNDNDERYYKFREIKIGNNVFIGTKSIILPGVSIGNNVIIGAGSVVTKSIEDNSVVAGNPARVINRFELYQDKIKSTCSTESYKK
ncbi:acyltransferase [Vibrio cholerae]|nr:acyltransferase [Vibrio cholerae]